MRVIRPPFYQSEVDHTQAAVFARSPLLKNRSLQQGGRELRKTFAGFRFTYPVQRIVLLSGLRPGKAESSVLQRFLRFR